MSADGVTYGHVVRRAWPLLLAGLVIGGVGTAWLQVQGLPWFLATPLLVMLVGKVVGVVIVRMLNKERRS